MREMWNDGPDAWSDEEIEQSKLRGIAFGKGGGGTTTVNSQTPAWLQGAQETNWAYANNVANRPYEANPNLAVAPPNNDSLNLFSQVRNMQGQAQSQLQPAFNATQQAMAYQPNQISSGYTPQQIAAPNGAQDIGQFMNPFTQQALQPALQGMEVQRLNALNQTDDQARSVGAFGGSRTGIAEGATNAAALNNENALIGQMNMSGYNTALSALQNNQNMTMQAGSLNNQYASTANQQNMAAQMANQQAGFNRAGLQMQGANQIGQLATTQSNLQGRELSLEDTIAQQQQGYQQNVDNLQAQQWQNQWNYPLEMQSLLNSAVGMAPYPMTQTQYTGPAQAGLGNYAGGALGGAALGASVASAVGQSAGLGAAAGGVLGAVASSDPKLKEDVEPIGTDPWTGLSTYSWRWKGSGEDAPRQTGLMADEVQQKYPQAVTEHNGIKGILTDQLDPQAAVARSTVAKSGGKSGKPMQPRKVR